MIFINEIFLHIYESGYYLNLLYKSNKLKKFSEKIKKIRSS